MHSLSKPTGKHMFFFFSKWETHVDRIHQPHTTCLFLSLFPNSCLSPSRSDPCFLLHSRLSSVELYTTHHRQLPLPLSTVHAGQHLSMGEHKARLVDAASEFAHYPGNIFCLSASTSSCNLFGWSSNLQYDFRTFRCSKRCLGKGVPWTVSSPSNYQVIIILSILIDGTLLCKNIHGVLLLAK